MQTVRWILSIALLIASFIIQIGAERCFAFGYGGYIHLSDIALEPSGERYWVATDYGIVYQIDMHTHQVLQDIETPGPAKLIDVSSDGRMVMVGGEVRGSSTAFFYELRNIDGGLITSVSGAIRLSMPVFSADGRNFITIDGIENNVRVYDCASGEKILDTGPLEPDIYTAGVHRYSVTINEREWTYEYLYAVGLSVTAGQKVNERIGSLWVYKWNAADGFMMAMRNDNFQFGYGGHGYNVDNFLFSPNASYFSQTMYSSIIVYPSTWSICESQYLNYFQSIAGDIDLGGLFEIYGGAATGFSDDEEYFWAIPDNNVVKVQEILGEQRLWDLRRETGYYAQIGDLCTIDGKPMMLTFFREYIEYREYPKKQGRFVLLDVETGEWVSESPPLDEVIQFSDVLGWMLHE